MLSRRRRLNNKLEPGKVGPGRQNLVRFITRIVRIEGQASSGMQGGSQAACAA